MTDTRSATFLIIGGQRCGTGWIAQCLREHPEAFVAPDETRFFDRHFERGAPWWHDTCFQGADGASVRGEKTAEYLYVPEAAQRIADYNPRIKLICCLRDPVTRFESALAKTRGRAALGQDLDTALTADPAGFSRGEYARHLQVYLDLFGRQSLLVLRYEDKDTDPAGFIAQIYRFLGLDDAIRPPSLNRQTKPSAAANTNPLVRLLTHRYSPFKRLYTPGMPSGQATQILTPGDRARLAGLYAEDRARLETLLEMSFAEWIGPDVS